MGFPTFRRSRTRLSYALMIDALYSDRILKLVADWLCANLRPGDIVARFAGDAFGVLLQDVSNKEVAAIGTELVKRMQSESFVDGDRALSIRFSIGATMIRGTRVEPAKLVNRAIQSGSIFEGDAWKQIVARGAKGGAVHFIGLHSDGNVHSHLDHLEAMLGAAAKAGVKKLYVHALQSGSGFQQGALKPD